MMWMRLPGLRSTHQAPYTTQTSLKKTVKTNQVTSDVMTAIANHGLDIRDEELVNHSDNSRTLVEQQWRTTMQRRTLHELLLSMEDVVMHQVKDSRMRVTLSRMLADPQVLN
jgi:hypothetical protein